MATLLNVSVPVPVFSSPPLSLMVAAAPTVMPPVFVLNVIKLPPLSMLPFSVTAPVDDVASVPPAPPMVMTWSVETAAAPE